MGIIRKTYKVEVTDEEINCMIVIAKLALKLLIEYFTNRNMERANILKKAFEELKGKK